MIWRVDIFPKKKTAAHDLISQINDLGMKGNFKIYFNKVYFIEGSLKEKDINKIASALLVDPVIEDFSINEGIFYKKPEIGELLIAYNPGVSDSVALSLEKAISDFGFTVIARTARAYQFIGFTTKKAGEIAEKILYNPLIEHILDYEKYSPLKTLEEFSGKDYNFDLLTIDILGADKNTLETISQKGHLSLNLEEMGKIKEYFRSINRNPTDCELETIACLWSEHCAHKTFRGIIKYEERDESLNLIKRETINNLLKSTIMKATRKINSPHCVSVFSDNSGIVKFDEKYNICFKVETHNHPSSLEPYGGASTGIGGVIRDILGTGCSASPFASIDVFCFSPWNISYQELPKGLLHPKRIIRGVHRGVRDYGNRMGIPTVSGAVLFDERFLGNPLVYCGTLGIIPADKSFKKGEEGDLIILCGAKTGRDGIHGATFSSQELDEYTINLTSAVQIGNAIEEKKLTSAILRARDKNLFNSITDCGAGGICSAITELSQEYGAEVYLEKVPLKYKGLSYTEIWISESQERMVLFAKEKNLKELKKIFEEEEVELSVVGKVTGDKKLVAAYHNNIVVNLDMDLIFNLPQLEKKAVWINKKENDYKLKDKESYNEDLKKLLSSPNIAAKDWILKEYDHEVKGGSVVKSLFGIENLTASDASVVRPDLGSERCVAIGLGINPFYSDIDPYWMAACSLEEALRNVVSAGGKLEKTFILDNFSWGSPLDENLLGGLVRAAKACYDFSTYFGTPFISGKDSLYNEYVAEGKRISIPGTLLVSAVSIIDDWRNVLTTNFKKKDNLIYIIGNTKSELGRGEYFRNLKIKNGIVPKVNKITAKKTLLYLSRAQKLGSVLSCHDLSEGGLGVAISEMCIGSDLGANIFLEEVPKNQPLFNYEILFSETPSRFIVEVDKDKKSEFEKELKTIDYGLIGCVAEEKKIIIYGKNSKEVINLEIESLRQSWMGTFKEFR